MTYQKGVKHRPTAEGWAGLIRGTCKCGWKGPARGSSVAGREAVRRDMAAHAAGKDTP